MWRHPVRRGSRFRWGCVWQRHPKRPRSSGPPALPQSWAAAGTEPASEPPWARPSAGAWESADRDACASGSSVGCEGHRDGSAPSLLPSLILLQSGGERRGSAKEAFSREWRKA